MLQSALRSAPASNCSRRLECEPHVFANELAFFSVDEDEFSDRVNERAPLIIPHKRFHFRVLEVRVAKTNQDLLGKVEDVRFV